MKKQKKITKILIANRSEIAVRIIATAQSLGIKTVSIYTQEDATSPHVYQADEAYKLSGSGSQGYCNQQEIISIAAQASVDAIHPGYGFLAENAQFAQRVIGSSITWIGPQSETIALMGDKIQARIRMDQALVPVVPGVTLDAADPASFSYAQKEITDIGYPIIIKSALGGGGKAMRKVTSADELETAWNLVKRESEKFFGGTKLIIEKYIEHGRHIEVQIAGDGANIIHLYERECSIQRRHQKIIEEAPCNFISDATRSSLLNTAVKAAQAVEYDNVGTIEFIVTPNEQFYFLEMNTRLQVEHAVTELTTGIDLVALQIELAQRRKLTLEQKDISQRGHAIQARIYSEDPENNFSPCTGTISDFILPHHPFMRTDHALEPGSQVTPLFDPMLGKIIVAAESRTKASGYLENILGSTAILGVKNNISFLRSIIQHEDFSTGKFHTQWLKEKHIDRNPIKKELQDVASVAAALTSLSDKQIERTQHQTSNWRKQRWI